MTDEEHQELHHEAAEAVDDLLFDFFDNPSCRAAVLLAVLGAEMQDMTEAEDVRDIFNAMNTIMFDRLMSDQRLFNTQGSA